MDSGQLVKASITNLDTNETITFEFNPAEYSISKTNNWATSSTVGENVGELEFSGGNPIELTMALIFDTSLSGEDVQGTYTSKLWKLAMVNQDNLDPTTNRGADIIVGIDNVVVSEFDDLLGYIVQQTQVGQNVTLTILRDGQQQTLNLTLGARPATVPQQQQQLPIPQLP